MSTTTESNFQVDYTNSVKDIEASHRFALKKHHPNHKAIYLIGLAVSLIPVILVIFTGSNEPILWIALSIGGVVYFLSFLFYLPSKIKIRKKLSEYAIDVPINIKINDEELYIKILNNERTFSWGVIDFISSNAMYIFITTTTKFMIIIPSNAFKSKSDFKDFLDFAKSSWMKSRS